MKHIWTKLLFIILFVLSNKSYAQSSLNLAIPQSPQSFQQDRVRAGDVECSAAIGSSTNVEFGVVGILNQNDPFANQMLMADPAFVNRYSNQFIRDVGVYGRITIPLGAPKERLNCNLLYKLELEKKQLELIKLRQEIQMLRNMQFEN
jgi:hypothetical protein